MTVTPNCKIRGKVSHLLTALRDFDLTALSARADASNKLVSVVEIAKRQLDDDKQVWYQYTGCSGRMEQFKSGPKSSSTDNGMTAKWGLGRRLSDGQKEGEDEAQVHAEEEHEDEEMLDADTERQGQQDVEEPAFEQMVQPERDKVRLIPIMTVFLSRNAVPELRQFFA